MLKDRKWEGIIEAGTPIAHVIPFKRDNWQMEIGNHNELAQEINKFRLLQSTYFYNIYKKLFWQRKKYD